VPGELLVKIRLNRIRAVRLYGLVRGRGATTEELELLYRARFETFLRVASAVTRDPDAGRDAVQSAFVSAVRNRRSFRGSGGLDAWVWTIVLREARKLARAEQHVSLDHAPEAEAGDPSSNGHGDLEHLGVRRFIASLPERQREAVFLRYFADLDYRTIARVLEVEPGTVSATLSAAHQTLRKRLEARTR
jgi:RNA polymerase sigma factor (sigma-70 family)